jgi:anaerobic selenocysteine-containing dehydrogenase
VKPGWVKAQAIDRVEPQPLRSLRLLYPLKRNRPKGDPDPGWKRISWDEALDLTASRLRQIADEHGLECVAFSLVSPSTSASDDSVDRVLRLMNTFGSPNLCAAYELCAWGCYSATHFTSGASVFENPQLGLSRILYGRGKDSGGRLVHA